MQDKNSKIHKIYSKPINNIPIHTDRAVQIVRTALSFTPIDP